MTKIFLTGDRSAPSTIDVALVTSMIMLGRLAQDRETVFLTGDNDGFEAMVRHIAPLCGIPVEVVQTPRDANGHRDWPKLHTLLAQDVDSIVFLHGSPFSSRIGASLFENAGEKVEMLSPELVLM